MKRKIRLIAFVCLCFLMTALLSSCSLLENIKEQHIIALDDSFDVLEYKGNKYMSLEVHNDIQVVFDSDRTCYATEKDVPLLLVDTFGDVGGYDETHNVIKVGETYYCTLDMHGKYTELIKNGSLDHYKSSFWEFDDKKGIMMYSERILDKDLQDLIDGTMGLSSTDKAKMADNYMWLNLDRCDGNNLLEQKYAVRLYWNKTNNTYGIRVGTEGNDYAVKEFPRSSYESISELFNMTDYNYVYSVYGRYH